MTDREIYFALLSSAITNEVSFNEALNKLFRKQNTKKELKEIKEALLAGLFILINSNDVVDKTQKLVVRMTEEELLAMIETMIEDNKTLKAEMLRLRARINELEINAGAP